MLLTCIKRQLLLKTNFRSFWEWPFYTGFPVHLHLMNLVILGSIMWMKKCGSCSEQWGGFVRSQMIWFYIVFHVFHKGIRLCKIYMHSVFIKSVVVNVQSSLDETQRCGPISSALDKLLGQLGIYATWLSSIAYLQKQLRIFIFFYATFSFSVITPFLIAWSHRECACIFIHSHCLPF